MKCAELFHYGATLGYKFTLLDIGGGFPGAKGSDNQFELMSAKILETLDRLFYYSNNPGLKVIAEPGRFLYTVDKTSAHYYYASCILLYLGIFFACSTSSLAVRVIGKRVIADGESKRMEFYINDGVYGSFNTSLSYHILPGSYPAPVQCISHSEKEYETTIWRPTCDSSDKVCTLTMTELNIGDWLWFDDMGSYTTSTSSNFNGYGTFATAYYITESVRYVF